MSGSTKSATGVRNVCRSVKVSDLEGGAENQQKRAAKNNGQPPGLPHMLYSLLKAHPHIVT